MSFFNREAELAELHEIAARSEEVAQFTVVTGRRRVGKTSLVLKSLENGSYLGATFVKAGAATLTIPSWILQTPLVVREGTLVVTKTGVTNGGLKLAGGTFKSGAEAIAVGALELSGNATIDAGTGSISFADSSAVEWSEGAKLTIPSSVNLRQDVVKFGSSANGLTAAQLKAIVWAGGSSGHVTLDANGYLRPLERFIITIR